MNDIFQFIGTFASIFSIPLAIIFYFKTSDARQNKIRLEIIRSLSYRIGEGKTLNRLEVSAVFNSKVREYNIRKPLFTETSILEDIIADAVSNPFLTTEQKTIIIQDISNILGTYNVVKETENAKEFTDFESTHTLHDSHISETKKKRDKVTYAFSVITGILSMITAIAATFFADDTLLKNFSNIHFPFEVLVSMGVSIIAGILVVIMESVIKKIKKK